MSNDFASAKTESELLGQLAGAASLCWEPRPTGVFDSTLASDFVNQSLKRLQEIKRDNFRITVEGTGHV